MGKNERKQGWLGYLLVILTSMVLLTSWSLCGTYAKYVSDASGSSTARVAKFEVRERGDYFQSETLAVEIAPGQPLQREITVENSSEVAIAYTIRIENLTKNLPLVFSNGNAQDNPDAADANNQSEVIMGKIAAGDNAPKGYVLNIAWKDGENDPKYAGMTDLLKISLEAIQVD